MSFVTSFELRSTPYRGTESSNPTQTVKYILRGHDLNDEYVAAWVQKENAKLREGQGAGETTFASGNVPNTPIPEVRNGLYADEISYEGVRDCNPEVYYVQVRYSLRELSVLLKPRLVASGQIGISFDLSVAQVQRKRSISLQDKAPATAPDQEAVGISRNKNGQQRVAGYRVNIPAFRFTVRYRLAAAGISAAVVKKLADHTAKVNSAAFFGFPAGSVLFLGARGSTDVDTAVVAFGSATSIKNSIQSDLSLVFEYRENNGAVAIPGIAGTVSVDGWDLLDVVQEEVPDGNTTKMANKFAYVHQIYDRIDHNGMF